MINELVPTSDSSDDDSTVAVQRGETATSILQSSTTAGSRKRRLVHTTPTDTNNSAHQTSSSSSSSSSTPSLLWTKCSQSNIAVELNYQDQDGEDLTTTRVMWHDEGIGGHSHSELDCFLLCFPTQLIPMICQQTSSLLSNQTAVDTSAVSALNEAELLRYMSILIAASMEGNLLEQGLFSEFWTTNQSNNNLGVKQASHFAQRFGMTLERMRQINDSLKIGNPSATSFVSIKQFLDGLNQKRKTAIHASKNICLDDLVVFYCLEDSDTIRSLWIDEIDWKDSSPMRVHGILKSVRDVQTGICLGLHYVQCDDIDPVVAINATFRERTRDAIANITRPFIESARSLYCSEKEVVSLHNIATLAEKGFNIVAQVSTGFDGLKIREDWISSNVSNNTSLLAKATLKNSPSTSEHAVNDELYLLMPVSMSREIYLFNSGSTSLVPAEESRSQYFYQPSISKQVQMPEIVKEFQNVRQCHPKNHHLLTVSCHDEQLDLNQGLTIQIFNTVVIQSAIDAFHVYSLQGNGSSTSTNSDSKSRFVSFVNRLAKAMLDKSGMRSETHQSTMNAAVPVESVGETSSSSPTANSEVNNNQTPNVDGANAILNFHEQHRLLALSKLPYYAQYRQHNKRAKRRCRVCHHPTGFYCSCCSNIDQGTLFALCHPTTKPDSRCYFEHLQG